MLERFFKLSENGTNVKTEVIGGLTTFFTMAYIIFVNPGMLGTTGMNPQGVMVATCISAAIGTLIMGLYANLPFAMASGMGLNAFFAFTVCGAMGFTWQQALAAVFISGVIFIILSVTGLRTAIVNAIPMSIKIAISAGIGLFIAFIGLINSGLIHLENNLPITSFNSPATLLAIAGLIIMIILMALKVKGAILIGIVATSLIGIVLQLLGIDVGVVFPTSFDFSAIAAIKDTFFKMDFVGLFNFSAGAGTVLTSIISVLITLTMIDMFDTVGTLIGTATKAKMLDKEGKLPNCDKALLADAVATSVGACCGTSTVTTYVESSAGIAEGARTGLSSVVVSILFIVSIFFAPVLGLIPGAATAPALVVVGILMVSGIKDIDWADFEVAAPAFLTMAMMPFAYSIGDGIGYGCISYVLIKLVKGKAKEIKPTMYVIAALFLIRFVVVALTAA